MALNQKILGMQQALNIFLEKGIMGAVCVIALIICYRLAKLLLKNFDERLREKDEMIQRLMDTELREAHIIELFKEVKPLFEEIRELLRKWYSNKVGL